jgi:hypothetical protein
VERRVAVREIKNLEKAGPRLRFSTPGHGIFSGSHQGFGAMVGDFSKRKSYLTLFVTCVGGAGSTEEN